MSKFKGTSTLIIAFMTFPLLGLISFMLPILVVNHEVITFDESLDIVSVITLYFEKVLPVPTIILLLGFGVIIGLIVRRFWFLLGLSSILIFPCVAIYEILNNPSSHNLWPFEFLVYGVFSIPPTIGVFVGEWLGKKWSK